MNQLAGGGYVMGGYVMGGYVMGGYVMGGYRVGRVATRRSGVPVLCAIVLTHCSPAHCRGVSSDFMLLVAGGQRLGPCDPTGAG